MLNICGCALLMTAAAGYYQRAWYRAMYNVRLTTASLDLITSGAPCEVEGRSCHLDRGVVS